MHRMKQRVPDVLVATPGRLVDLLENEGLDIMLRSLRVLVYDEADQRKYYTNNNTNTSTTN
jgi:ATP-dependent RNA helicase MSS116, mitochondrial